MSTLYLLRHAKAAWAQPGMRDVDRPLDRTGVIDAGAVGLAMHERHYQPELTLCSTARRARQTLDEVAGRADTGRVVLLDSLYSDDAAGYLETIRRHGRHASVLVIGHNPMMEDLAAAVSGSGDVTAMATLKLGFPTSGLAIIRFSGDLSDAEPGQGHLEALLTPADL